MSPDDVVQWLEDWVDENLQTVGYHEDRDLMSSESSRCRADAAAAGIHEADLLAAAGGDLAAFLLAEQNAITDAEVRRLAGMGD